MNSYVFVSGLTCFYTNSPIPKLGKAGAPNRLLSLWLTARRTPMQAVLRFTDGRRAGVAFGPEFSRNNDLADEARSSPPWQMPIESKRPGS